VPLNFHFYVAHPLPGHRFHEDRGTVSQHLGDTAHNLRRVVARAHDRIGAQLGGMVQHQLEGVRARLLAETGQERDIASYQRL